MELREKIQVVNKKQGELEELKDFRSLIVDSQLKKDKQRDYDNYPQRLYLQVSVCTGTSGSDRERTMRSQESMVKILAAIAPMLDLMIENAESELKSLLT